MKEFELRLTISITIPLPSFSHVLDPKTDFQRGGRTRTPRPGHETGPGCGQDKHRTVRTGHVLTLSYVLKLIKTEKNV